MLTKSNKLIMQAIDSGDYRVDAKGIVYGRRGKPLVSQFHKKSGRYRVKLSNTQIYVHRIVGYAKFGTDVFSNGVEIHHIDDNPLNNHPDNLELVWRGYHLAQFHAGEKNKSHKTTWEKVNRLRVLWTDGKIKTYAEAGRFLGIADINAKEIILNRRWRNETKQATEESKAYKETTEEVE